MTKKIALKKIDKGRAYFKDIDNNEIILPESFVEFHHKGVMQKFTYGGMSQITDDSKFNVTYLKKSINYAAGRIFDNEIVRIQFKPKGTVVASEQMTLIFEPEESEKTVVKFTG